jgi:hypothetical protein
MKNRRSIYMLFIVCALCSTLLSGCTAVEKLQIKFGLKNLDFEYIKQNKIDKIVIQSTRDLGFRFIVTDKRTIKELYDILSSSKKVDEKSSLEPDYIFEMYEGDETVYKFKYITGLEKKDAGNLYSEDNDNIYIVSKRIDNDIIRNLWNLRKPREFEKVYYGSILAVLDTYKNEINKGGKIGIDISEDIDVAKYVFSTDLENFKEELKTRLNNVDLVNKNRDDFDILVTVKTQGYKSDKYRSVITVYNKKEKSEKKYYTGCKHENGDWEINVDIKAFAP